MRFFYYTDTMYYVYILECCDKSLYTGYTNHLEKRIKAHNEGKGAKYTKGRRPVSLVYFESFQTKSEALICNQTVFQKKETGTDQKFHFKSN